jgi:hypothetical protein
MSQTIRLAADPLFYSSRASVSPKSESSIDEEEDDGFAVPFTTSPLDSCRGGKSRTIVRGVRHETAYKKEPREAKEPKEAKEAKEPKEAK